jgi:beta-lactamase regulating signal transducer with metallopeptidase domain
MDVQQIVLGAEPLLRALLRASFQGALFIAAVWGLCRCVPQLPAWLRGSLWWIACLKLLASLVGIAPVPVPLRPATPIVTSPPSHASPTVGSDRASPPVVHFLPHSISTPVALQELRPLAAPALAALWLMGVLVQLGLTWRQLRAAHGLVRRAEPLSSGPAARFFEELRDALGVSPATKLCVSDVEVPQVVGLLRPTVILPRRHAQDLSEEELRMVLAHELLHVRRGDLWLGWVPVAAQRLFFFHPLARLALREYVSAREAACDAEVLRLLEASPRAYGRLLLGLGVSRGEIGAVAAGAAPSLKALERRISMLQLASQRGRWGSIGWGVVIVALVGLVPIRVVARGPARRGSVSRSPEHVGAASANSGFDFGVSSTSVSSHASASAGGDSTANTTTTTTTHTTAISSSGEGLDRGDEEGVVLTSGKSICFMSGSSDDADTARELRRKVGHDVLFFRRGEARYVIDDPAVLKRAKAIFEPQIRLGEEQAELGSRQAELGSQQADLGAAQAQLGGQQARLSARQARLASEQARHNLDGRDNRDLEALMSELARQERHLGEQQSELGVQQGALGEKQSELGEQQGRLGEHQGEVAEKARVQLRALLERALAEGQTKRI